MEVQFKTVNKDQTWRLSIVKEVWVPKNDETVEKLMMGFRLQQQSQDGTEWLSGSSLYFAVTEMEPDQLTSAFEAVVDELQRLFGETGTLSPSYVEMMADKKPTKGATEDDNNRD